ncbi:putative F-box/kelch-repeat protein At3g17540 [Silene latifolia]|uniref:putative F-box/kelch-repeat protein At3g17540 n=1 Tax=Silene latifolia TaxID=37657 RepID=UPI003D77F556
MEMMSKKKTKTSIKYLPLEIWTLILARMPGKTLLRFRSVCKPWCSIIDDPDFVYLHLPLSNMNNNTKNKLFVAFDIARWTCRKGNLMTIRRADNLKKTGHNLMSSSGTDDFPKSVNGLSCNGLILMWQIIDNKKKLRLWNPSIRKTLLIPPCPIPSHLHNKTEFVFGFAPSTKEHKILAITFDENPNTQPKDMFFAVYTLSDQRWSVRNNGFNVERSCFEHIFWSISRRSDTIFCQGAVHSMAYNLYGDNKKYLVSLDFDSEKFTFLELPDSSDDKSYTRMFLFILGESLAVLSISQKYTRIWVLEHDDGGNKVWWSLWFSGGSTRDGHDLFMRANPYSRVFYYDSSDYGGCLIIGKNCYCIASGQVKERGKSMRSDIRLETYLESLVLLHK